MPAALLSDLELGRQTLLVAGPRVRVRPNLTIEQANALLARGMAELSDDFDDFEPAQAQRSLKVTQYGYDLILGRIESPRTR